MIVNGKSWGEPLWTIVHLDARWSPVSALVEMMIKPSHHFHEARRRDAREVFLDGLFYDRGMWYSGRFVVVSISMTTPLTEDYPTDLAIVKTSWSTITSE